MITDCEALSWIKNARPNPLHPDDVTTAGRMLNSHTRRSERMRYAYQLECILPHYPSPAARADILVYLGNFAFQGGQLDDIRKAVQQFTEAASLYRLLGDAHCLSAALWLLGMSQRELGMYKLAFDRWLESRDLVIDLHREAERLKREEGVRGRKTYASRIIAMTAAMLAAPHDMFEWMYAGPDAPKKRLFAMPKGGPYASEPVRPSVYQFLRTCDDSATRMGAAAAQIRKRIDALLEHDTDIRAIPVYQSLEALNQGPPGREFCEIHAYCATLTDFVPELREAAIRHLITARCTSPLQSRARMIICWMLGLLLIHDKERHFEAVYSMEASIACARRLEASADRDNNAALRQWYGWHAEAMQRVLAECV